MKTWEEIESVDDLVLDTERNLTKKIEESSSVKCPHLRKLGNFFFYCEILAPDDSELKFEPSNRIYLARQSTAELQLHCMSDYETCCYFKKILKFP